MFYRPNTVVSEYPFQHHIAWLRLLRVRCCSGIREGRNSSTQDASQAVVVVQGDNSVGDRHLQDSELPPQ